MVCASLFIFFYFRELYFIIQINFLIQITKTFNNTQSTLVMASATPSVRLSLLSNLIGAIFIYKKDELYLF